MRSELIKLLRDRRRRLGWTQSDLARCLGSSISRVSKMEADDRSVSLDLMARAAAAMVMPLVVKVDDERDPMADPGLSPEQRQTLAKTLFQRKWAERIADRHGVDAGDVRHVIFNLELSPAERLRSALKRARLRSR